MFSFDGNSFKSSFAPDNKVNSAPLLIKNEDHWNEDANFSFKPLPDSKFRDQFEEQLLGDMNVSSSDPQNESVNTRKRSDESTSKENYDKQQPFPKNSMIIFNNVCVQHNLKVEFDFIEHTKHNPQSKDSKTKRYKAVLSLEHENGSPFLSGVSSEFHISKKAAKAEVCERAIICLYEKYGSKYLKPSSFDDINYYIQSLDHKSPLLIVDSQTSPKSQKKPPVCESVPEDDANPSAQSIAKIAKDVYQVASCLEIITEKLKNIVVELASKHLQK